MTTIQRWNEWFEATGDEKSQRAWASAKQVHADPVKLDRWATIIELNRLDRVVQAGEEHQLRQAVRRGQEEGG